MRDMLLAPLVIGLLLTGCATIPGGPSVMVLPGAGKSFEQFQTDDFVCRQWAAQQIGITPGQAAAGSPATGTAVGAGAGLLPSTRLAPPPPGS